MEQEKIKDPMPIDFSDPDLELVSYETVTTLQQMDYQLQHILRHEQRQNEIKALVKSYKEWGEKIIASEQTQIDRRTESIKAFHTEPIYGNDYLAKDGVTMKKGKVTEGVAMHKTMYGKSQYTRGTKVEWPGEGPISDEKQKAAFLRWTQKDEHFNKWLDAKNEASESTDVISAVKVKRTVNKDVVKEYIKETGVLPPEYEFDNVITHSVKVTEPK